MKVPKTETITESLQNCSLHHENGAGEGITGTSDDNYGKLENGIVSGTSLDLNSHVSLPYNWEHFLDIKSEDGYYINRRNGEKPTEDPRTVVEYGGGLHSDEDDSWHDSDDSSSESSSSRDYNNNKQHGIEEEIDDILVVGGCRSCYMYFMVPKKAQGCPKCNAQLLRFDQPQITPP